MKSIANQFNEMKKDSAVFTLIRNSRFLQICAFALVAQLVAAAFLGTSNKRATFARGEPVFDVAQDDINSIDIGNGDESISLKKQDDDWKIDVEQAFPADPAAIESLLGSLTELKTGLPVASTINARDQMEVADDNYQRKLVVNDDKVNTYFLGTSPGLRKAHLRRQDSDDIFSASLPVSDISTTIDQWLDKSLLAMNDIDQIKSDAITFNRVGSGDDALWEVPSNEDNSKALDADKLITAVSTLEKLRVSGLSGSSLTVEDQDEPDEDASSGTEEPGSDESEVANTDALESVELVIGNAANELTLILEKLGDNSTVRRSDIDQLFSIPISTFDSISILANADGWLTNVEATKTEATNEEKPSE